MKHAIYGGSFDLVTNGHLCVISEGSDLFDELIVGVATNPHKSYTFSENERIQMMTESIKDFPNVRVVGCQNKFLVDVAAEEGASYLLRGIRNASDYETETTMYRVNSDLSPDIKTVFVMPTRETVEISSSFVKGLVTLQKWENVARQYVPKPAFRKLLEKFELNRWADLCKRMGATDRSQAVWEDAYNTVIRSYSESSRHYHTMIHIIDCLIELDSVRHLLDDPEAVEMALWLHDVVYDTKRNDNEERSAELAREILSRMYISSSRIERVVSLILHTKSHQRSEIGDYNFLSDIDLAILGSKAVVFDGYESDIREEYRWVPSDKFRDGRVAILDGFLKRPRVFFTDWFRNKYENVALDNLARSIRRLITSP